MEDRYLTRRQLVALVRERTGIPVTESRLDKEAMLGTAPKPAALYGRRHLYTEADGLAWARSLIRPVEA
jgi:hypothetical protein